MTAGDFRRLMKDTRTMDDFTGLKKRANVYLMSKTWQAKGDKKSETTMSVHVSNTVLCSDVPLSTHTPHTCHFPRPKAPGQLSLPLNPDHHNGYDSIWCSLSIITELLWSFSSFALKVRFDQSHILFSSQDTPAIWEENPIPLVWPTKLYTMHTRHICLIPNTVLLFLNFVSQFFVQSSCLLS